jgi:hypothetical protein
VSTDAARRAALVQNALANPRIHRLPRHQNARTRAGPPRLGGHPAKVPPDPRGERLKWFRSLTTVSAVSASSV